MTNADVASCWLHVSEHERASLANGIVPGTVQTLAASLAYEAYQARWNANAAKPTTTTKIRRRAGERRVDPQSSRTAGKGEGL